MVRTPSVTVNNCRNHSNHKVNMDVELSDTLNKSWKENKSNFGYRMLAKMGWSEDKGKSGVVCVCVSIYLILLCMFEIIHNTMILCVLVRTGLGKNETGIKNNIKINKR